MPATPDPGQDSTVAATQSSSLGAEIRRLRLAANLTQEKLGDEVGLGSARFDGKPTSSAKSAISRLEKGQAGADNELLHKLAAALHTDFEGLRRCRDQDSDMPSGQTAQVGGAAQPAQVRDPLALVPSRTTSIGGIWSRVRRQIASIRVVVAVGLTIVVFLSCYFWLRNTGARSEVRITAPAEGSTVPQRITVRGTITGYQNDDLWLDVRGNAGDTHHPTETPCIRAKDRFTFTPLYVGQNPPKDDQRSFSISVLAVKRDSVAEQFLYTYANRPADSHQYDGVRNLPHGIVTVDTVAVVRGPG